MITLRAEGRAAGLVCKVETGKALVEAGLHPATGGDGIAACSGDMLLEALVACAGVTLRAVATAIGVEVQDARIRAEGDLDFRGTLGVAKDVPVGFTSIRLELDIDYERERGAGGHAPQTDRTVLRRPADAPVSAAGDCADRSSGQRRLMVSGSRRRGAFSRGWVIRRPVSFYRRARSSGEKPIDFFPVLLTSCDRGRREPPRLPLQAPR